MRVKISDRDLKLMLDLYDNVFLSFYQIRDGHFKGLAKPTVYNRLSKLIKADYLRVLRVNLTAYHLGGEDVGALYQITKKGIQLLSLYFNNRSFRKELVPINTSSLYHDLVLTDVLRKLKNQFPEMEFENTRVSNCDFKDQERVPDAILIDSKSNSKLALELELTVKSERRYRDILMSYRTNSDFKNVIYIVLNDSIQNKIGATITGFGKNYSPEDDTGKIYFAKLSDLFDQNASLKITNGVTDLCLSPHSTSTMEVSA